LAFGGGNQRSASRVELYEGQEQRLVWRFSGFRCWETAPACSRDFQIAYPGTKITHMLHHHHRKMLQNPQGKYWILIAFWFIITRCMIDGRHCETWCFMGTVASPCFVTFDFWELEWLLFLFSVFFSCCRMSSATWLRWMVYLWPRIVLMNLLKFGFFVLQVSMLEMLCRCLLLSCALHCPKPNHLHGLNKICQIKHNCPLCDIVCLFMDTRRTKIEQLDFWWFDGIMSMLIVRVLDLKKKIVWNKDFREWGRVQVLNLAICARPEYDLPIFCTDFVSTASRNIIVLYIHAHLPSTWPCSLLHFFGLCLLSMPSILKSLSTLFWGLKVFMCHLGLCGFDSEHLVWSVFQELAVLLLLCRHYAYVFLGTCRDLNPLYNIEQNPEYKDKYFLELLPMANKYAQVRNSFQECGSAQVARKDALATKLVCLLIYLFTPNFWLYEWKFSDSLLI